MITSALQKWQKQRVGWPRLTKSANSTNKLRPLNATSLKKPSTKSWGGSATWRPTVVGTVDGWTVAGTPSAANENERANVTYRAHEPVLGLTALWTGRERVEAR